MLVFTNGQPEYKWTKGDILRHFGVSGEDVHVTHTQQIAGGHVFLKKNPVTENLIRDWLHVFYDHLHLADNSPSASPNLPGFVENRYDQSIFSILCKLQGIIAGRYGNLCGGLGTAFLLFIPGQALTWESRGPQKKAGCKNAGNFFFPPKRAD